MSDPKKQHYVPQTYLRQFAESEGYLNIYDIVNKEFRKQKPSATGYSKHFYTASIEGEKDYFVEKYLAENIDILYSDLLFKIANKKIFNSSERYNLGLFLAAQYLRTPDQRRNYNRMVETSRKQIARLIYSMKKNTNQLTEAMRDEKFARMIENGEYNVIVPKEHSLAFLLSFIEEMARMLAKHTIIVLEAPKKSEFITSDNPYTMVKEKWAIGWPGFGVVNTIKLFPFSPRYLLILKGVEEKMIYPSVISSKEVRIYNQNIIQWADRYLFSKNEYILTSIVKKIRNLK